MKFGNLFRAKQQPKIVEKNQFLAILGQKFDKSSEPAKLDRRRDACNSAKWPQYNPFEMGKKIKISPPLPPIIQKSIFCGQNGQGMTKYCGWEIDSTQVYC